MTLSGEVQLRPDMIAVQTDQLAANQVFNSVQNVRQFTGIRVYPDANHLADAVYERNERSIPMDDLGQSRGGDTRWLRHAPALGYPPSEEVQNILVVREIPKEIRTSWF